MGTRQSKPTPSAVLLHDLFIYSEGVLKYRRYAGGSGVAVGDEAGYVFPTTGYRAVGIAGKRYLVHRVIWKMFNGTDAPHGIDHIDGNRLNNRIENLRLADQSQNGRNAKVNKNNKCGVKGVFWNVNKWQAKIMLHRRTINLGRFEVLEDAAAAVRVAREKYHGDFARAG